MKIKIGTHALQTPGAEWVIRHSSIDKYRFMGVMYQLWCMADKQSRDGTIAAEPEYIDHLASHPGLAESLSLAGWITIEPGRIRFAKEDPHSKGWGRGLWKSIPKTQRQPIPSHIRRAVLTPGVSCVACDSTDNIQIDHIVPVARGGSDRIENLQPLCRSCNLSKATKPMSQFMEERGQA